MKTCYSPDTMQGPRKIFYNRKQYWKRRTHILDRRTLEILNAEARGGLLVPLKHFFDLGYAIAEWGEHTEKLYNDAVGLRLSRGVKDELRDGANMLELFSKKLKSVVEKKWGSELPTFPVYCAVTRASGALPLIPAVRALFKMGEEE